MGVLTESMTRLRDEILDLRNNRQTFRAELEQSTKAAQFRVSALRKAFASDLAGAHGAWFGYTARGDQITGADRPARLAGVASGAHGVALKAPPEHHGETRIPAATAAAMPFTGKPLSKKRGKR